MKSSVEPTSAPHLTAVARFVKAVGLAGDLKVELLCDGPDRLRGLSDIWIGRSAESAFPAKISEIRVQGNGVLVRIESWRDRSKSEQHRGAFIFVQEADTVRPKRGTVRIDDLIGCEVESEDGIPLGVIREVYSLPGGDAWGVWTGSQEVLVPAVKHWIRSVDIKRRRVVVARTEGLFE